MDTRLDLAPVADFLHRFNIGIDDLFFAVHLGAERIAHNEGMPPSSRQRWSQVAEACRSLWQDFAADGVRLNPPPTPPSPQR